MTAASKTQTPWLLLAVIAAMLLIAGLPRGCSLPGWEIMLPIGKVRVQPIVVPAPPVPATRCLIFGYDSCQHCRELHRTIRHELIPAGWRVGSLPTDDIEEINIHGSDPRVNQYRTSSWPTLIIIDRSGKELDRRSGALNAEVLIPWLQSFRK